MPCAGRTLIFAELICLGISCPRSQAIDLPACMTGGKMPLSAKLTSGQEIHKSLGHNGAAIQGSRFFSTNA